MNKGDWMAYLYNAFVLCLVTFLVVFFNFSPWWYLAGLLVMSV